VALRALRENRWLVLDELNRADIDKAFGPLLTVLSGGPVDLPTVTVDGRPVRIEPSSVSGLAEDGVTYRAGPRWRIIATMNTLDRAALFSFSLAFARRFAFVLVPAPSTAALLALVQRRVPLNKAAVAMLERLLQVTPRPLGPAIVLDAARYIAARADPAALVEALGAFVLPQFEGVDQATLGAFVHDVAPVLGPGGEATLREYVRALYGEG
jgi:MoxR-like ATPase